MNVEQLKLLAQRLRGVLERRNQPIGHSQSLDEIAALPGLRNWPEVLAFPHRVAAFELDILVAERLASRLKEHHAVDLMPRALLGVLVGNGTRQIAVQSINPWDTRKSAVYEVALESCEFAYMRVDASNCRNNERVVVVVDAQRFLSHWRADRNGHHVAEANGNPSTWIHDYKFEFAVDGFALGAANPVPLAQVGFWLKPNVRRSKMSNLMGDASEPSTTPVVAFTDGITRTFWLLVQGAPSFPVECSRSEAELLSHWCGASGVAPQSVAEITGMTDDSD
ncbi:MULTISPECIES: plasmid fertility inhibition factor family protein [Variovorax]|jgi:hypothetical protein|uniref:plasmid fertility inhibition factor family protein n=1 Tax=Variovorax TaxID=34072 RepID=UPI00086BEE1D|nr:MULTISPECIES: glyoxalase superfamily protein [Variovorax]MBN8755172.1 hypothetical protein [Variovorax sp.]ODU16066.1 MAG: hypothetical protein ABS94_16280 [Variovorax sp. SCN 67-85]ODV22316.1 MAG: hypothetical protein ABT25_21460 [Variovorax sp. SCN 67-20]OJZ14264.1 MAG: hypothetical protein BGP22_06120 [Variovorax sp. 67-131]UKI08801.1 glyoxalase superfamily protein [Variovorax paradoxus]